MEDDEDVDLLGLMGGEDDDMQNVSSLPCAPVPLACAVLPNLTADTHHDLQLFVSMGLQALTCSLPSCSYVPPCSCDCFLFWIAPGVLAAGRKEAQPVLNV
eukprot:scaffold98335_cov18-Tisochrysis_lutea.AAC.3